MALILPRNKKVQVNIGTINAQLANNPETAFYAAPVTPQQQARYQQRFAPAPAPKGPNFQRGLAAANPINFVKGVASTLGSIAQAGPRAIKSFDMQMNGQTKDYTPKNAYEQFFLGKEPVKNLENYGREAVNQAQTLSSTRIDGNNVRFKQGKAGNELPSGVALGLGAVIAASDLNPIGGARKKGAKETTKVLDGKKETVSTPPPTPTTPEPRADAGVKLQDLQKKQAEKYNTPPVKKAANSFMNQAFDPRHVEQRYDNQTFKIDKQMGETLKGQTDALPNRSLAAIRGRIADPFQPAAVRDTVKYAVDDGRQFSLDDIIKTYGKDDTPKAKDFETYRIFMDELEQRDMGVKPSIGFHNEEMASYVDDYLKRNPEAPIHHQALRAKDLQDVLEKEQAGVIPQGSYDALSQRKFYIPRTEAIAEEAPKIKMSGGVRSGQKGIQSRKEFNAAPTSPLSLYKDRSIEHERDLANQLYGTELKRRYDRGDLGDGFTEVVNADTVIRHKELQNQAKDIRKQLVDRKRLRDKIAADRRRVALKQSTAARTATSAKKSHIAAKTNAKNKLQKLADEADTKLAESVRKLIIASKGDQSQVLNDLIDRDPNYEIELKAARDRTDRNPNLTAKERRDQINYDTSELKKKYPSPNKTYSKADLLEIASAIGRMADEVDVSDATKAGVSKKLGRRVATRKVSNRLQGEVDDLRAMLEQARTDIKDADAFKKDINKEFRDTTQYRPFDTQAIQYRKNGEVGRIEIPGEFADNLSKQNESMVNSILDKAAKPIADTQKLFWTGPLSPAFKLWNVLVKNPLLMTINANGVSGIGYNAAKSWVMPITNNREWKAFKNEMQKRGMSWENAFQSRNIRREMAADVARKANVGTYLKGAIDVKGGGTKATFKDVWKAFSNYTAVLDNKQRYAVSYGAYARAKRLGYTEPQALEIASAASAQVFGDFERVTQVAKALEVIAPYTGATQAGTRALYRSAKTRPAETAVKVGILASGMAALTAYSLSNSDEENDYYKDMIDKGQEWRLDNNWVIVLPGAKPNDKGEWSGVISVPLLPDIRPMNRAIWKSVYDTTHDGKGVDAGLLAGEMFNQLTGDVSSQVYDPKKATEGGPAMGVLPSSPLVNMGKTVSGINGYTGGRLADDYTSSLERTEQVNKNGTTTAGAKASSKFFGGALTPQQFDQIYAQMGSAGDVAQNPQDGYALGTDLLKPLKPGVSLTKDKKSGRDWIVDMKEATGNLPDEKTFRVNQTIHARGDKGIVDSAEEAILLINNPKALAIEVDLAMKQKARGEKVNPLFDKDVLDDRQRSIVLAIKAEKDFDPGDKAMTDVMEKQNPWLKDYFDKQEDFFDEISKKGKTNAKGERVDKNGEVIKSGGENVLGIKKPEASAEVSKKFDVAAAITDPKTKSEFYKNNTDVTDYLAANEEYNRAKRAYIGLPQLDKFPGTPEQEAMEKQYFALDKAGRKSFIKSNPALGDYWTKKAMYQLNEAGARARYEGEELDNDALKDAKQVGKLADSGDGSGSGGYGGGSRKGGRRGGRGGSGGGGGSDASNPRQYKINEKARSIARPKVTVKGGKGKKPAKAKVSKPKVTSKKSLV